MKLNRQLAFLLTGLILFSCRNTSDITVVEIPVKDVIPDGIAVDSSGRIYLSNIRSAIKLGV